MTNDTLIKFLRRFDRALAVLQEATDESATLLAMRTFMSVAFNEGASVTDISKAMRLPIGTVSRHLLDLGLQRRNKAPGMGLVEPKGDPLDMRIKRYYLTKKGRAVFRELAEVLSELS